jgi:hypothetical protein
MRTWNRAKFRRAAVRYAEQGWHVVPGAYMIKGSGPQRTPSGLRRFDCGQIGCRTVACHPAVVRWEALPRLSPAAVIEWWRIHPYSVLLATGHEFDVLEVPARLGRAALLGNGFAAARGPVAVTPGGRWMFLVRPGHSLLPELAEHHDVVLHGLGSWVPAPPSPQFGGQVRWELPPEQHGWRPAEPYAVQELMLAAIGEGPPPETRDVAWRPITWAT